ncbi:MAG: 4Fe-4S binding protein [Peptococcaceae bacterium]|nr:4Fe-4S binding protein [Peptococcaceae bacterium]
MGYRITEECLACGTCVESCPNDAIIEGEAYKIDPEKCENCGTCIDACPTGAIVEE